MSILIKGINFPKSCWDCKFCLDYEFLLPYECAAANKEFENGIEEYAHSRPNWCPLVEVPPHGRLIDADALMKDGWKLYKWVGFAIHEMPLNNPSIPTIIEAEVDDG